MCRQPVLAIAWMLLTAVIAAKPAVADQAADNLEAGKRQKAADISAASATVAELEAARNEASKKQRFGEMKRLTLELKQAREHLRVLKDKSVEDFAKEIAAQKASEDEARRVAEEKAAEDRQAQLEQEKNEAERLRLTGGCPLEITALNFFHTRGQFSRAFGRAGPSTVAVIWIVNRAKEPVDAHEVLIQFFDAFDALIAEHTLQGALLKPGEEFKATNGLPEAQTAITMKVFVKKTKLADGTIWERLPEHKATGRLIKKPEGAKILD